MLGINYGPDDDPLAVLKERTRGAISVYARGDDYHEVIKPRLKQLGRWLIEQCRRRHQGLRRHRAGDGEAARRSGRPRLAGQAHQSGVARTRLVAVPRRDLHHARSAARCAGARPLRHLPRLPRRLPDRGFPGAVPARCAALHFLSDHRAQGPDPARIAPADGQPHLWLRRLPGGLSVEQVRAGRPRGEACGARGVARAAACRTGAARRCRRSARCSQRARSSASAASASCAMC